MGSSPGLFRPENAYNPEFLPLSFVTSSSLSPQEPYCVVEVLNGEFREALRNQHVLALGCHFFEAVCKERK